MDGEALLRSGNDKNPTKFIKSAATIFANYERLANLAESNTAKKEELEFSYIFELLEDKCVLFYIAIRQTGKSMTDTIAMMTNYMIEPINNLNYEMAKQVFQQLYIGKYMHENYTPIP